MGVKQRPMIGRPPTTPPMATDQRNPADENSETVLRPSLNEPEPRSAAYLGIFLTAAATFFVLFYIASRQSKISSETVWQPSDLALFNGTDPELSPNLLLSIAGSVFDVSKGSKHYGVGKSYNHFCGRDASRAFITGNYSAVGLTDNVANLTHEELISLQQWREFFFKTYPHVGKLAGRFYDSDGKRTKVLENLDKRIRRAQLEVAKGKLEEEKYPHCNSRWTPETGGEIWCETGYPRKIFTVKSSGVKNQARCACIQVSDLEKLDHQEYPNCPKLSTRCITSPP